MRHQIPVDDAALADASDEDGVHEVAPDIAYKRLLIVNVVFFGRRGSRDWVLVDAGMPGTAGRITSAAAERFSPDTPPLAIVLTHGHTDHVGALGDLAGRWNVPIYAHELEHPHLNGQRPYPPPDPSVGGMMARTSPLFGRGPIDVRKWLRPLPADGSVPGMPGFVWLHTPGHTEGHVSLWRANDRTLIAGDAVITTAQESAYAVMTQKPELHGPPMYFTPDWNSARESAQRLARLEPELIVTGHGHAMRGPEMRSALHQLADRFDEVAIPKHGKYVDANTSPRPTTSR